jgi:hypothetical protein
MSSAVMASGNATNTALQKQKNLFFSSSRLLVVSSTLTFTPKVGKTVDVEELTLEQRN